MLWQQVYDYLALILQQTTFFLVLNRKLSRDRFLSTHAASKVKVPVGDSLTAAFGHINFHLLLLAVGKRCLASVAVNRW